MIQIQHRTILKLKHLSLVYQIIFQTTYRMKYLKTPRLKKHCFKSVALQADGFGVSDRAVAAIVSATLIDFGLEHMGPVDRNKIRRERASFLLC